MKALTILLQKSLILTNKIIYLMKYQSLLTIIIVFILFGCKENTSKNEITFKFIQINDVYEIAPLGSGTFGGMARVAHVRDSIKKKILILFFLWQVIF